MEVVENDLYTENELDEIILQDLIEIAIEDFEIEFAEEMKKEEIIEEILQIQKEESDNKIQEDNYSQEELETIGLKDLRIIAMYDFQIDGANKMGRTTLISSILEIQNIKEDDPYTEEELHEISIEDLQEIAKEDFEIDDADDMQKDALVIAILNIQYEEDETTVTNEEKTEKIQESEEDVDADPLDKKLEYAMPLKQKNILCTVNILKSIEIYLADIKKEIESRSSYKDVTNRLDYILIKRFLKTTYNNLIDIDLKIITPQIEKFDKELKFMDNLFAAFNNKTGSSTHVYSKVFLMTQPDYKLASKNLKAISDKLQSLKTREEMLAVSLEVHKKHLNENIKSAKYPQLEKEYKTINGLYSDTVHHIAELDERKKHDQMLVYKFEQKYMSEFNKAFKEISQTYRQDIIEILNALAFILDEELWGEAKKSEDVRAYFEDSSVNDNLNTQTYLKYYLDALDSDKANEETTKLFELHEYLKSINKKSVLVLVSSPQDALEYSEAIKKFNTTVDVKSFIDEKQALKWAISNNIHLLVIEDTLRLTSVDKFLTIYKKHVFLTPKIIMIGDKANSYPLHIDKKISQGASPKVVSNSITEILD